MKKVFLILGIVLAAALLSAGSFYGGMTYQSNKNQQAQANFFAARGQAQDGQAQGNGQFPGEGQLPSGRQGAFFGNGGGAIGQIKSIAGDVIQLSTSQNVTTVKLSSDTVIRKTVEGTLADLEPGMRITVTGERDSDGNITAAQIQVVETSVLEMPAPSRTPTAP